MALHQAELLLSQRYRLAAPPADMASRQVLAASDEQLDRPVSIIWLPEKSLPGTHPEFMRQPLAQQLTLYDSEGDFLVCQPIRGFWFEEPASSPTELNLFLHQLASFLTTLTAAGRAWPSAANSLFLRDPADNLLLHPLGSTTVSPNHFFAELGSLLDKWLSPNQSWLPLLAAMTANELQLAELLEWLAEPEEMGPQAEADGPLLTIYRDSEPERCLHLAEGKHIIGRAAEADIQLLTGGVAERHCQIEVGQDDKPLQVTCLVSQEITRLGSHQLITHSTEDWLPEQELQLGILTLRYQHTGPEISASAGLQTSWLTGLIVTPTPAAQSVAPGEQVSYQLLLHNDTGVVVQSWLGVTGLPAGWLSLSDRVVALMPDETMLVMLGVQIPAGNRAGAGTYPLTISLTTDLDGTPRAIGQVGLTVKPDQTHTLRLSPTQLLDGGSAELLITNTGNIPSRYLIEAKDPASQLIFTPPQQETELAANTSTVVKLTAQNPDRPWLGAAKLLPFVVNVAAEGGAPQQVSAQLESPARIPGWILAILAALLLGLCGFSAFIYSGYNRSQSAAAATTQAIEQDAEFEAVLTQTFDELRPTEAPPATLTPFPTLTPEPEVILPPDRRSITMIMLAEPARARAAP